MKKVELRKCISHQSTYLLKLFHLKIMQVQNGHLVFELNKNVNIVLHLIRMSDFHKRLRFDYANFVVTAYYRKEFKFPSNWDGSIIRLCFGAVNQTSEVWLNGQYLGKHIGVILSSMS